MKTAKLRDAVDTDRARFAQAANVQTAQCCELTREEFVQPRARRSCLNRENVFCHANLDTGETRRAQAFN